MLQLKTHECERHPLGSYPRGQAVKLDLHPYQLEHLSLHPRQITFQDHPIEISAPRSLLLQPLPHQPQLRKKYLQLPELLPHLIDVALYGVHPEVQRINISFQLLDLVVVNLSSQHRVSENSSRSPSGAGACFALALDQAEDTDIWEWACRILVGFHILIWLRFHLALSGTVDKRPTLVREFALDRGWGARLGV
jgi:hypothetical protein